MNLLKNPNFQPPYIAQGGIGEIMVAHDWRAGYNASRTRPEWRQAAVDWDGAQQFFGTYSLIDAWVSQRVNVAPYLGKIALLTVTCALQSKDTMGRKGDYFASIGIDRQGHEDVGRKSITWLTPQYQDGVTRWTELSVTAPIEAEHITVFIQASNSWQISGSMFIQSASLDILNEPVPPGDCRFDDKRILEAVGRIATRLDSLTLVSAGRQ